MHSQDQQPAVPAVAPVAVIGMALRFPGGNATPSAFWEFIKAAQVAIRDTPADRFDINRYFSADPDRPGTTYSRRAGYVDDPFAFDPEFFRISMAEAQEMDPQQRWMLQLCWSALENAGIVPATLRGQRVGVFLTAGDVDYARRTVASGDLHRITFYGKLGANRSVGVGRVAYTLGLQGPAIHVGSTCSSSLVAVHLAAQSLRCGDCDLAIAGGVNLILAPEETIGFARLRAMSTSDRCRTFDDAADGYIRGEGGAVVVLKRAREAAADNDRIEALLVGSSINNDGASNGLTAPNGIAQEAVIRQALAQANARPEDVAYVEAHGTGTPLGDPIELTALRNVYAHARRPVPLWLGALKPQIGHLEAAAGIAGLIKAILVLRHRHAPRQAAFDTPTTRFRWDSAMMAVPRTGQALPQDACLVAVSAFGISGTNAHALLAPPPPTEQSAPSAERMRVLTLSARSPLALRNLAARYLDALDQPDISLRDLCYTASLRRQHWDHRLSVLGANQAEMAQGLREFAEGIPTGRWHAGSAVPKTKLVFLFPGQGGWRPGIGEVLYRDNPIFRSGVDDCLARLAPNVAANVSRAILDRDQIRARHDPGQLAHFVLLYALARTWMRLGISPDAVIGHSLGEHAAAVIAGVMSLDDGLKAVTARGELFETLSPPGAMLAVAAGAERLGDMLTLGQDLFIAAVNGPEQTVLSGTPEAVAAAEQMLAAKGLRVSIVHTYGTPGHSPLLAPILAPFRSALSSIRLQVPEITMISTVTGEPAGADIASIDYWVNMVERPVLFQAALATIASGDVTFLEIGPNAGLANLAKTATGDWTRSISSLCDGPEGGEHPEPDGFAHACGRLYCAGHPPQWQRLYGTKPVPADLPTYAFETRHIEIPALPRDGATQQAAPVGAVAAPMPLPEAADETATETVLAVIVETIRPIFGEDRALDDATALIALGLDSLALMAMRAELQERFGHFLPTGMLAAGATLRGIAAFYANRPASTTIGQDVEPPASATRLAAEARRAAPQVIDRPNTDDLVVTLRDGPGPVVALVHPVGGDVLCYGELAAAWPDGVRIIGVRHREAEGGSPLCRSVPQLAELYRRALIGVLGTVPAIIGGWSFGGVVAQEMAWQWEQDGNAPSSLVVIDSPLPDSNRILRARAVIGNLPPGEDEDELGQMIRHPGFGSIFDEQHGLERLRRLVDAETAGRLFRIHAANAIALAHHVPRPIRSPFRYALALRSDNGGTTEAALARLGRLAAGEVSVLGFDCDHFTIVRAPAASGVAGFLGAAPGRVGRTAAMLAA